MESFDLGRFHPVIARWFGMSFGEPTEVQRQAWRAIMDGRHTLIAAPTGSGKTLAALLPCIDGLIAAKNSGKYDPGVRVLYVTPLKALNNDIHHHLFHFLGEMDRMAREKNTQWIPLTVGVRTGDTSQSTRASMLRKPPDILVTTPESLYILLTSVRGREMLRTVERIIVDEIHDLAADKRGVHLTLTLERLVEWCGRSPQRIGVSATQKPMERVARFLGGWEEQDSDWQPRPVAIVEAPMDKTFELTITMPETYPPSKDMDSVWTPVVEKLFALMEGAGTVLVFVNSRTVCERLTLRLNEHAGYEFARSHHGSVAREKRLEVERALKAGELRCLVATSSLELGIDVGHVDLVLQLDSPQSAAAGIQRIGRAGHAVGSASRGAIVARSRGVLAECAVLARLIALRDIEEIRVPRHCLDVLAQQLVAMVAADDWAVERLHAVIARSDCYRGFACERLAELLRVLAGFYPFVRPLIDWDRENGLLQRRKSTLMAAVMGAGTIPQSSAYPVHHAQSHVHLGELEEEFVHESRVGDVFQLGTSSWMIRAIRPERIYVAEAGNRFSEIPFWRGEAPGRSFALGQRVGAFAGELCRRLEGGGRPALRLQAAAWLRGDYMMDAAAADSLIALFEQQQAAMEVPTDRRLVVEHYLDDEGQTHLLIHNWFGRKFNKTWLLALELQYQREVPCRFYTNAKDNGIEFIFPDWDPVWVHQLWQVGPAELETLLQDALPGSPLFAIAFRRQAETSLLLCRSFSRIPAWKKRLRSEELLKEALPFAAKFPLFGEALREAVEEMLDIPRVKEVLEQIRQGEIEIVIRKSSMPSPLARQFLADYINSKMYESEALAHDLQMQLAGVSREMAAQVFGADAIKMIISPETVQAEQERLAGGGRPFRDADDLYRLLKERGDMTPQELRAAVGPQADGMLAILQEQRRVAEAAFGGGSRWICRDELAYYDELGGIADTGESADAVRFILKRYIEHKIAFTENELLERYALDTGQLSRTLDQWEKDGLIEPAPFADPAADPEKLWISSAVASRLIRVSLQLQRDTADQPLDPALLCGYLVRMHGLNAVDRPQGADGLMRAIEQLQGLFLPLSHWETAVFPARIKGYRKEDLDALCASGEVLWIGKKDEGDKEGKVAFFLSGNKPLYAPLLRRTDDGATRHPELLELLRKLGASFLSALSREAGRLPSDVLAALLELAWEGRVSNDQFAPLRSSLKPKNSSGQFRSGLGRWYVLDTLDNGMMPAEQSALAWAGHLLQSMGLVTRDLTNLHSPFSWDTMLAVMRRMEEWGIAARGLFVGQIRTLQFAAKETLVVLRQPPAVRDEPMMLLSSIDPANPFGHLIPWPEKKGVAFARKKGNFLVLSRGKWLYWIQNNGRAIHVMDEKHSQSLSAQNVMEHGEGMSVLMEAVRLLIRRHQLSKVVVDSWNGQRAAQASAAGLLAGMGAEKDRDSYVFWPSMLK